MDKLLVLDSVLELVAFYDILKDDLKEEIDRLAGDLEACYVDKPWIEVIHSGSGFEGLSLPHVETGGSWNTDADHMLVRSDIEILDYKAKGEDETLNAVNCGNEALDLSKAAENVKNERVYLYDGMHSGYVFLSSKRLEAVHQQLADSTVVPEHCLKNTEFIKNSKESLPLSNTAIMALVEDDESRICGPSYSLPYTGGMNTIHRDFVYSLKCKFWPSQADEWKVRERPHSWPSSELVNAIISQGCHVVPVGSHFVTTNLRDFEWRLSFSVAEMMLIRSLTRDQKLSYSILKALIKPEMKLRGIDLFSSYHLKTALLWSLELKGAALLQQDNHTLGHKIFELLDVVIDFYSKETVPNYFVRKNNMIDHHCKKEIASACNVLKEMKADLTQSLCHYIEKNQALPVFFDQPLTQLSVKNPQKFLQVCKYNFLLMALADILKHLKKNEDLQNCSKVHHLLKKSLVLHGKAKGCDDKMALSGDISTICFTAKFILSVIEDFLAADQQKVTENSAVILAVFNIFLATHPSILCKVGIAQNTGEFYKYLTNPEFKDTLFWAAHQHEKYCDAIYEFVVEHWKHGPQFNSEDVEAQRVMKLLIVCLGKPTKQASAVTGSLAQRNVSEQRFFLMRMLAGYLLHVHLESAFVAFQAAAYLMGKTALSEVLLVVNGKHDRQGSLRAVELILSKDDLKAQLSNAEVDKLIEQKHELMSS